MSPEGRRFNTYAKAQEHWQANPTTAGSRPGRGGTAGRKPRRPQLSQPGGAMEVSGQQEGPEPASVGELIAWQRSVAASLGDTDEHQRFFRALERAQRAILQVRSSRVRP